MGFFLVMFSQFPELRPGRDKKVQILPYIFSSDDYYLIEELRNLMAKVSVEEFRMSDKPPQQISEKMFCKPDCRDMRTAPELHSHADFHSLTDLSRIAELNLIALDTITRSRPSLNRSDRIIPIARESLVQRSFHPTRGLGYPDYGLASSSRHRMNLGSRNVSLYPNRQFPMRQPPSLQDPVSPNIREMPVSAYFKARNEVRVDFRRPKSLSSSVVSDAQMFKIELDLNEYRSSNLKVKVKDGWLTVKGKPEACHEVGASSSRRLLSRFQIPANVDRSRFSSVITPEGMLYISAPFIPRKEDFEIPIEVDDGSVDVDEAIQYPADMSD